MWKLLTAVWSFILIAMRENDLTVDCVIIGAGGVGACIAQQLAFQGQSVVVVDAADGIGGGCSYANAGILAPSHVGPLATPALLKEAPAQMLRQPPAVRVDPDPRLAPWLSALTASAVPGRAQRGTDRLRQLAHLSTALHLELAEAGLSSTLHKTGAVDVYLQQPRPTPPGFMTADELRSLEPSVARASGGTHEDAEWVMDSRSFVTSMLEDARRHGAEVRFGAWVTEIVVEAGRAQAVQTTKGTLSTQHVVLAAGLGSRELAARAGVHLPLRGGRGYVVDVAKPADAPQMPVRVKDHRIVVTPMAEWVRVAGSIEFGREGRPVDASRGKALLEVAATVLPCLQGATILDLWGGDRPCTPDGLPIIGAPESLPNLHVAAGHGMWGMILAPISAALTRDRILDGQPDPVSSWLRPDRFPRWVR